MALELPLLLCTFEILLSVAKYRSILIPFRIVKRSIGGRSLEMTSDIQRDNRHNDIDKVKNQINQLKNTTFSKVA